MHQTLESCQFFTHAGCMDGSASAILFMHAGGLKENIHYVPAGRVDAFFSDRWERKWDSAPIIMVDVAPNEKETIEFLENRPNTTVIDHHKTSEGLIGRRNFVIDAKNLACGCENFRRWLVDNRFDQFETAAFKRFTAIVDDHDRWLLNEPFSLQLAKFLSFVGQKDFVERFMDVELRFGYLKGDYWTDFERDLMKLIERRQDTSFRSTLNKVQVREREFEGRLYRVGYVISDEVNNSEMLNLLLQERPEIDVACQISFGLQKVSLRSRQNGPDVSRWCKRFRGGGHAAAAGHPLPEGLLMGIIEGMHK